MQNLSDCKGGFSLVRSTCSACLGFLLCCGLLFLGAILIDKGALPERGMEIMCWGIVAISALFTAFGAAGKHGRRILGSLCAGALFFAFAMVCGEVLGGVLDVTRVIFMGGILLVTSCLGAILSGLMRG